MTITTIKTPVKPEIITYDGHGILTEIKQKTLELNQEVFLC